MQTQVSLLEHHRSPDAENAAPPSQEVQEGEKEKEKEKEEKEKEKKEEEKEKEKKKEAEPNFQLLENPARVMPAQLKVLNMPETCRYQPFKPVTHASVSVRPSVRPRAARTKSHFFHWSHWFKSIHSSHSGRNKAPQ